MQFITRGCHFKPIYCKMIAKRDGEYRRSACRDIHVGQASVYVHGFYVWDISFCFVYHCIGFPCYIFCQSSINGWNIRLSWFDNRECIQMSFYTWYTFLPNSKFLRQLKIISHINFVQRAEMAVEDLTPEEQAELQAIRDRKAKLVAEHRRKKSVGNNHPIIPKRIDADRSSNTDNMKVSPSLIFCPFFTSSAIPQVAIQMACKIFLIIAIFDLILMFEVGFKLDYLWNVDHTLLFEYLIALILASFEASSKWTFCSLLIAHCSIIEILSLHFRIESTFQSVHNCACKIFERSPGFRCPSSL